MSGEWRTVFHSNRNTLNEFEDLVYRFTNNDPDHNGINDTYGLSSTGLAMVYGAFGWQRKQWNEVNG